MPDLIELPESACIASVVLTMTRAVGTTRSPFTFEESSFLWQGASWSLDFRLPPITDEAVAADWQAFGLLLEGSYGYFLMGNPAARLPRGVATGTPQVDGAGQDGTTLETKGWTPSTTGILKKGSMIQYGTGELARLHMLVADADSDAAGKASLEIRPALRYSPADSAPIVINDAKGVFRLSDNDFSWSVDPGKIWRFSFRATEVVNA